MTTITDIPWANIDYLADVQDVQIHLVDDGIDDLALLHFDLPEDELNGLIDKLEIRPPRPNYRTVPSRKDEDPTWWTPYGSHAFVGTQGLKDGIGREMIVHTKNDVYSVFLRVYQI